MATFKNLLSKELQNQLQELKKEQKAKTAQTVKVKAAKLQNPDDSTLFAQAMMGVTPLKHEKTVTKQSLKDDPNALLRRAAATGTKEVTTNKLSDMQALLNPVAGDAFLSYKNPTLQNKVFEQLKQGKLRWYNAVDLHGSTIDEARDAVLTLINDAIQNDETAVKIVHGKGIDAILKTCVNGWLRQMDNVLAFVSAPSNDGGTGAVLVLLKRKKSQHNSNV